MSNDKHAQRKRQLSVIFSTFSVYFLNLSKAPTWPSKGSCRHVTYLARSLARRRGTISWRWYLGGPLCLRAFQALAMFCTPLASTSSEVVPGLQGEGCKYAGQGSRPVLLRVWHAELACGLKAAAPAQPDAGLSASMILMRDVVMSQAGMP